MWGEFARLQAITSRIYGKKNQRYPKTANSPNKLIEIVIGLLSELISLASK